MKQIVVGMSGGVDSSMTLVLLKQQGWNPIGVSLKLAKWDSPKNECKENACCTEESFRIAKEVCEKLNVPYYIYDVSKQFQEQVMDYFIDELKHNRTPNPCVVCNRRVKYKYLFKWANEHNIQHVATGHYAKVQEQDGIFQLKLAKDTLKDQTYGLSMFPQEWLKFVRTPLGDYTKQEVYELAKQNGFEIFKKLKQSQDLCFVSSKSLDLFIQEKLGEQKGNIVDLNGKKLGEHKGLHFYTIGQTKKLYLPGKYYVKKFNPEKNELIVTSDLQEIKTQEEIILQPYNFTIQAPEKPIRVTAKVRYGEFINAEATLYPPKDDKLTIKFDEPKHAVTPGQFCVFYQDDVCLGGGVITASCEQQTASDEKVSANSKTTNKK
jgi:tRNA-uridine 2-sulfurtransferase